MLFMHQTLFNNLNKETHILKFYSWIVRGLFSVEKWKEISELINNNIERLHLMRDQMKWDGHYDFVVIQHSRTIEFIKIAKHLSSLKQVCDDDLLYEYVRDNPNYYETGVLLYQLAKLFDIDTLIKRGHLLHDRYFGYTKHFYSIHIDCFDYLNSAAHFYNEGFDYYFERKEVKSYLEIMETTHWTEHKRVQGKDEVCYRNFREAYINLIFFVESFINSVGYHGYLSGVAKSNKDENQLIGIESINGKGFKNYSNLKQRIKNISRILGGQSLDCDREPYKTYLQDGVVLRNQYVHSSVDKPKMNISLEEWKNKCDLMIDEQCMGLVKDFWKACYPQAHFPIVIANSFDGNSFKGRPGKFYAEPN
ncbi:hypothetical protein CHT99_10190 [Sphingobacterium cellulitidis]|nr:hypothetical protein CHT99_10190 [Sphingobacterium cellulitidis]